MLSIEEWLYKLAQDKTTPAEILRILSKDSITIQYFIADTNCSTDVLEILDKNKYWLLRDYIAQHLNCPEDVLKKLSQNEDDYGIRSCVAKNPNCSVDILKTLSKDERYYVRSSVAQNLT